tara:strand:+ start:5094 stop:6581 length:1488 start_codon:yes stop_codon:yes gene_type:complete
LQRKPLILLVAASAMAIDVQAFVRKNGFIWGPEPEVYGGVAGFYSYGPLGKLLKNKVEAQIRQTFRGASFWEVEAPTVMPEVVWTASGHLGGFVDPIVVCKKCSATYRIDKLIEEKHDVVADAFTKKQLLAFIKKKDMRCPSCKGHFLPEIQDYNLMMKTEIGIDKTAYLRPETATTTYLPFKQYYELFRKKLPVRVFQIGKAFRNEISPRQSVIRGREFTQAEAQMFIHKADKKKFDDYKQVKDLKIPFWPAKSQKRGKPKMYKVSSAVRKGWLKNQAYAYCLGIAYSFVSGLGIPESKMRFRQHTKNELAHYAEDAWDLEINLPSYGWTEVLGVHDRADYDLKQHQKHSGKSFEIEGKIPHVLEIAFGSDRPTYALIDLFLAEEKAGKNKRVVLKLPKQVAPLTAAVFPLVKKDGLQKKAREIYYQVLSLGVDAVYDDTGSIGKLYRRQDEKGTPFCITIDYQTKKDNTVTVRDRDTMKQKRVKLTELDKVIL